MTPGKLNSLVKFKKIKFEDLKCLIVDEADYFFADESSREVNMQVFKKIEDSATQ